MITIFSADKTFFLTTSESSEKTSSTSVFISIETPKEMRINYTNLLRNEKITTVYFHNKNLTLLFDYFSALFTMIDAAGGLVKNNENKWLFIFRNDKWDLPKGKVEKDESITDAAVREVEEECGIKQLTIIRELNPTYHIYELKGKAILKRSYWFEMICKDTSPLIPQTEEGITDAKWLNKNELKQVIENTYPSIKEVIRNI